ncbi:acetate--CoA ligase family protein [Thioalkalivibrio sp. HK1]|uniref:acetate--CoA ligase family protein n=1 Tax=Thioalkalivibrio sp. HK1 TaxID=1469245 RepID=UPI0004AE1C3E|nr:acetate--CoA ligase family protein [Thioalkalivibrio sp. HK1]
MNEPPAAADPLDPSQTTPATKPPDLDAERFARLLRPRSIALIGGTEAARVARQCDAWGYQGEIWPVHPKRKEVEGRPVFRSLLDLPRPPDAAFIGVNRHAAVKVAADLARVGASGAICYASGFGESDETGKVLQDEMVEAAGGMPLLGPNCYGLINFLDGVALWPDQHGGRKLGPGERGVAIVTQSSNIAISLTMQQRGLPLAYLLTAGNQAAVGLSRIALALLDDERVSALGLHIEGFDSVAGFEALAHKARERRIPVVAIKTGRSERGRCANLGHTASVAGSDAGAGAFLHRLGFGRVHGLPELIESLKLLHVHGPLAGRKIGAMCCSGGEAALLSDAFEQSGLDLADIEPEHHEALRETVHPLVRIANPLDYHTFHWGNQEALARTFATFAANPFDALALVIDFPRTDRCEDDDWWIAACAFEQALEASKTKGAVIATMPETLSEAAGERLMRAGIAPLAGVQEALCALECAAEIGKAWNRPPPPSILILDAPTTLPGPPLPLGDTLLDEAEAKARLAAFSLSIPEGGIAQSIDEALSIAERLLGSTAEASCVPGGASSSPSPPNTVAIKALGVAHKSDIEGLALGLSDPSNIRTAARRLLSIGNHRVLIERCVSGAIVELLVGIHRDPRLGLLLTIGAGGVLVELMKDRATLLLPTDKEQVRRALTGLRCAPLLFGFRGRPAADIDAGIEAILAIARFAGACESRLGEIDINPLALFEKGAGAMALDAMIRIEAAGG